MNTNRFKLLVGGAIAARLTRRRVRCLAWTMFAFLVVVSGCALYVSVPDSAPQNTSLAATEDASPRAEPKSKYGNPSSYVVLGKTYHTMLSAEGFTERGTASWYGKKFHGRKTSSGEIYDMYRMTAAHKHLPLPTYVEVTNLRNKRRVIVKVNDRGPFHDDRIIDLSYAAARKLGIVDQGTGYVEVKALTPGEGRTADVVTSGVPQVGAPQFLQIGAFADRTNAERLGARLRAAVSVGVHIDESISMGKSLFKVKLGPLERADFTEDLMATLVTLGIARRHFVTQ